MIRETFFILIMTSIATVMLVCACIGLYIAAACLLAVMMVLTVVEVHYAQD